MGDEPDLDPDINKDFFENNVLQLDPSLLTENGMKCFERFFKAVNCREGKLVAKRRAYMMDDLELIGLDYLWRVRRLLTRATLTPVLWLFFVLLRTATIYRPKRLHQQHKFVDGKIYGPLRRLCETV